MINNCMKISAFSSLPCSFSRGFPCTASRENDLTIYFLNAKHVMIDEGTLYSYHSKPRLDWELPRETKRCIKATLWSVCPMRQRSRTKFENNGGKMLGLFFKGVFNASNWCAKAPPRLKSILCFFMLFLFPPISEFCKKNWEEKAFLSHSWEAFCIVLYSCNVN